MPDRHGLRRRRLLPQAGAVQILGKVLGIDQIIVAVEAVDVIDAAAGAGARFALVLARSLVL